MQRKRKINVILTFIILVLDYCEEIGEMTDLDHFPSIWNIHKLHNSQPYLLYLKRNKWDSISKQFNSLLIYNKKFQLTMSFPTAETKDIGGYTILKFCERSKANMTLWISKKNQTGIWGNFVFYLSPGDRMITEDPVNDTGPLTCLVHLELTQ